MEDAKRVSRINSTCSDLVNICLCLQGKPVSHNFLPLEMTAAKGATSVQVASHVTWAVAEEIVITPTDYGANPFSIALAP
jgi:hypothetical protein